MSLAELAGWGTFAATRLRTFVSLARDEARPDGSMRIARERTVSAMASLVETMLRSDLSERMTDGAKTLLRSAERSVRALEDGLLIETSLEDLLVLADEVDRFAALARADDFPAKCHVGTAIAPALLKGA